MRLGRSQHRVFNWLVANGPASADDVGAALYSATSACYNPRRTTSAHRRNWARRLLKSLADKGIVSQDNALRWNVI